MASGVIALNNLCSSDSVGTRLTFLSTNGAEYRIAVYESDYAIGMEFTLSINCIPMLGPSYPNYEASNAAPLSQNQWESGNFIHTNPTCESCNNEVVITDLWYQFYFDPEEISCLIGNSQGMSLGFSIYQETENPDEPLELIQCFDDGSCYYHVGNQRPKTEI